MSSETSGGSTRTPASIPQSSLPSQEWLTRSLSAYQQPLQLHGVQSGREGEGEEKNKTKTEEEDQINEEQDGVQEEAEEQELTEKLEKERGEEQ